MNTDKPIVATPKQSWRKLHALGLPAGSVRALLALMIFGGIWAWLFTKPEHEVPSYLRDLMFIIMGHYFASRSQPVKATDGPAPLFLPRGSIRLILLLGFLLTAGSLMFQHRMVLNHAGITLILVSGFMLGVLLRSKIERFSRPLEDLRAIVSILAAVGLLLLMFKYVSVHDEAVRRFLTKYRTEDVLAALVGFYFGSRS